jgi:N-acetyl-anhydromuramyl-L-alanine amidase AmpD
MQNLMLNRRIVFVALAVLAALAVAAGPASAATHPEAGGHAAGIPNPPARVGVFPNPMHVLGPSLFPALRAAQYPGALWEPASPKNYTVADRPLDLPIKRIIIHVAEGGFRSTYEWFKNPAAKASAHYVVGYGGEIAQMVPEQDIAWHAGNWAYNETAIGIEHAGYTNHTWFPDKEYRGSAHLAAHIADKYWIVPDRKHVIGHNEVPDPFHPGEWGGADHHTDPGRRWNWGQYMAYLRADAHDTYQQVVDNTTPDGVHYSNSVWKTYTRKTPHQGPNYLAATGRVRNRPVVYRFTVPTTDYYDLFMWWPCNSRYSREVEVGISTVNHFRTTTIDESRHCGRGWNRVGRYLLKAGTGGRAEIGSRSGDGRILAADAMRIVEASDPTPPSAPTTTVTPAATSLQVSWTKATDDVAVGGYRLYINGHLVWFGTDRSATVVGLECGVTYEVSVRAVDRAGNRSEKNAVTAQTLGC